MSEQDDWGEMDEVNPQTPAAAATAVRTWWNGSGPACGATGSPSGNARGGEDNLNYLISKPGTASIETEIGEVVPIFLSSPKWQLNDSRLFPPASTYVARDSGEPLTTTVRPNVLSLSPAVPFFGFPGKSAAICTRRSTIIRAWFQPPASGNHNFRWASYCWSAST